MTLLVRRTPSPPSWPSAGTLSRRLTRRAPGTVGRIVSAIEAIPDDPALHRYLLAYASDFSFLGTVLDPHAMSWLTPGLQMASLDHVMWFHRPFRLDDWLLYVVDSPSASGARGLVRGQFFDRAGREESGHGLR